MTADLFCLFLTTLLSPIDLKWVEEVSSRVDPEAITWVKEQLHKDPVIDRLKQSEHFPINSTQPCITGLLTKSATYDMAVCISFSVPDAVWIELSNVLEKVNGAFILRGLPDNSFKKLSEKVQLLQKLGVNAPLLIDPLLFTKNNVETVPTFLVSDQDEIQQGKIDKISGNISAYYAIQKMAQDGETKQAKILFEHLKRSL